MGQTTALKLLSFCLIAAFCLPHVANLLGATAEGYLKSDRRLVSQGPYARYLSLPEGSEGLTQYQMFADGIDALNALGDPSQWGIIADHGITFEYATLSRPVSGYPLWQRITAPELAPGRPIDPNVDIVMLGRDSAATNGLRTLLLGKFDDDFQLCTTSNYWEVYTRRSSGVSGCA